MAVPKTLDLDKLSELMEAAGLTEDVDLHVDVYPPKNGNPGALLIRSAEADLAR